MNAMKAVSVLTLLCISIFISGCWNSRELEELAVVVGIGIDQVPETKEFRVTFQIIIPSGSLGTKEGAGGVPILVYSGTDPTIFGALRKTSQKVARQLFFAHTQQLIIGEAIAKEGIGEFFDFYERSHELRLTSPVLIARGTNAESVLRILTALEKDQAAGIAKREQITSKIWGYNLDVQVMDVVKALIGQGEVAISGIRIVGNVNVGGSKTNRDHSKLPTYIQIDGIALFKDKKLVKWLDGKEARGILWVRNKMKGTIVNVACKDKKEGTSIELIRSETKMKVNMVNGRPVFQIVIEEEGAVNEVHCPIDLSKHEEIAKLQDLWAEETEKEVIEAIKVAQGKKSDIFGFGEEVGRTYPKMWKKMKADWSELFAQGKIEVHAEAIIRRTGMRGKPHFINK